MLSSAVHRPIPTSYGRLLACGYTATLESFVGTRLVQHLRHVHPVTFVEHANKLTPPLIFPLSCYQLNNCTLYLQQTEHDFNLEKQTLVHEAKLNIQDEFTKKEKDREIQERITRSGEVGECRVKKMKIRDDLLNTLTTEAGTKCSVVARGQNYPQLLQKLIVQGLIKIEEMEVIVFCRKDDEATIKKVLPAAVKEYVEIMKRESTVILEPKVIINADGAKCLPETTYGGILLTALNGKIVCDNTMASRLNLVYDELLPSIRAILFPEV